METPSGEHGQSGRYGVDQATTGASFTQLMVASVITTVLLVSVPIILWYLREINAVESQLGRTCSEFSSIALSISGVITNLGLLSQSRCRLEKVASVITSLLFFGAFLMFGLPAILILAPRLGL